MEVANSHGDVSYSRWCCWCTPPQEISTNTLSKSNEHDTIIPSELWYQLKNTISKCNASQAKNHLEELEEKMQTSTWVVNRLNIIKIIIIARRIPFIECNTFLNYSYIFYHIIAELNHARCTSIMILSIYCSAFKMVDWHKYIEFGGSLAISRLQSTH